MAPSSHCLVHTDQATFHYIIIQSHLAVRHIDFLTVEQNSIYIVKYIPGVMNRIMDALSHHADCQREWWNLRALGVTAAGEWVDDIQEDITDD